MVAKRRDGEGKLSVGPTWESIVERQIREAMEDGAFDGLPYQGAPIPLDDDSAAGERALGVPGAAQRRRGAAVDRGGQGGPRPARGARRAAGASGRRRAITAGAAPGCAVRSSALSARRTRAIERLNAEAPTDRQHRRPLNPEAELARLEAAFGA